MSATRDQSQKITFLFTRLQPQQTSESEISASLTKSEIIKVGSIETAQVKPYHPSQLLGVRNSQDESISKSLTQSLNQIEDLQSRLKFMLSELKALTEVK
jgi:hypothetical protein